MCTLITFSAGIKIKCFECNSHDYLGCLDPLFSGIDTSQFRYYCKISYYPLDTDTYYRHTVAVHLRAAIGLRAAFGKILLHQNSSLFTVTFGEKALTLAKSRGY